MDLAVASDIRALQGVAAVDPQSRISTMR